MLNIISDYNEDVEIQNGVSGITKAWNKSKFNKKNEAAKYLDNLICDTDAKYILLSYNNEGLVNQKTIKKILKKYGKVKLKTKDYNTYRGSRNLRNRDIKVKEQLWILKKKI